MLQTTIVLIDWPTRDCLCWAKSELQAIITAARAQGDTRAASQIATLLAR